MTAFFEFLTLLFSFPLFAEWLTALLGGGVQ